MSSILTLRGLIAQLPGYSMSELVIQGRREKEGGTKVGGRERNARQGSTYIIS